MVKEWRTKLRAEGHVVEREIRQLERSEETVKKEIKKLAKLGDMKSARMLAKVKQKGRLFLEKKYYLFELGIGKLQKSERTNVRNKSNA
jgi:hypothetical protein